MKKRILIGLSLLILCAVSLLLVYLFSFPFRTPVVDERFSLLMPSAPLVYVQCSHLKARLEQLSQSAVYADFLRSPLLTHLKKTPGWHEFTVAFQEFLEMIVIDPTRIIGTDLAIGVYEAENKNTLPGMLAVSRIDRVVRAGERLLQLFDRVSGQIGFRFIHDIEGLPVYVLERPDMLMPIYYCTIDDVRMLSTSLPLLKKTIFQALGKIEDDVALTSFRNSVREIPESRAVTFLIHPARVVHELYHNQFLTSLQLVNRQDVNTASTLPFITFSLDVYPKQIILETAFIPAIEHDQKHSEAREDVSQTLEGKYGHHAESVTIQLPEESLEEFPLLGKFQTAHLIVLLHTLEALFPQQFVQLFPPAGALRSETRKKTGQVSDQGGTSLWQWVVSFQKLFGKTVECRLSKTLLGTLYTVPDIACISEPSNPTQADSFLDKSIDAMMEQAFSSPTQRAFVKKFNEPYQDTEIASIRLLLQDIFSYSMLNGKTSAEKGVEPSSYAFLTTNTAVLKKYIDLRLASPAQPLSFFMDLQPEQKESPQKISTNMANHVEVPIASFFINNQGISEWLKAVSHTRTFSLIWSPKEFQELYHILPTLLLVLESLPPAKLHVTIQGTNLLLSVEISEERS